MVQCVAIVQEGKRKGHRCEFDTNNDDRYCNRHQRNKIYDVGITEGKLCCRFFFRGCDSVLSTNAKDRIKHAFDKEFFLEKATIISSANHDPAFYDKWCKYYTRIVKLNYDKYKKETIEKRNFTFNLTKE